MNIVIAGISGFLGSRLENYFKKKNYKVFDYKKKKLPKKIDLIINVSGPDRKFCSKHPIKSISERIKVNKRILNIVKKKNVLKYFYISTVHVYKKNIIITEKSKLNYKDPYSKSHILSEKYILEKFKNFCHVKIIRLANCFGYCNNLNSGSWDLVINDIVKNIFIKNKILIKSKINFYKDFVPISYFLFMMENLAKSDTNKIINLTSGNMKNIYQICKDIKYLYMLINNNKINIEKNFFTKDKKFKIKSKIMKKSFLMLYKKFYYKDLKELIIFSKKVFI